MNLLLPPIETFIYYSGYTSYRMVSTIQLSNETKRLISTFGTKEDSYEDIIKRMYKFAVKEQLREFLMSSENTDLRYGTICPAYHQAFGFVELCHL